MAAEVKVVRQHHQVENPSNPLKTLAVKTCEMKKKSF